MDEPLISLFQKFPILSTILTVLLAAHALAVVVVNLTPTPKDDAFLGKFYGWVEKLAGIVSPVAKDYPGESLDRAKLREQASGLDVEKRP